VFRRLGFDQDLINDEIHIDWQDSAQYLLGVRFEQILQTCAFGGRGLITGGFEQQVLQFAHRE